MNNKIKISLVILFSLSLFDAIAQENDTLVAENHNYDSILSSNDYFLDVLFYKYQNDVLINNLGPFGSPNYYPTAFGLNGINRFYLNSDLYHTVSELFAVKPYTNVSYINASRKEQVISVSHYQKFGKLIRFSFDFTRLSSPGAYINQEANNTLFDISLSYKSKLNTYGISVSSFIDRSFLQENGGLLTPVDFENNVYSNRRSYNVNLPNSTSSNKRHEYNVNQQFKLFSLNNDTVIDNGIYLNLNTQYLNKRYVFNDTDPLSPIYTNNFIDTLATVDSIYQSDLSNMLMLDLVKSNFKVGVFSKFDVITYDQKNGIDTSYNDINAGFYSCIENDKIEANLKSAYVVSGYRKADVVADLNVIYSLSKSIKLSFKSSYHLNEPNLRYVSYSSNHFEWRNNDFKKQSVFSNQLLIGFKNIRTELSVENKMINKYVYIDSTISARQHNNQLSISTFRLAKDYRLLNFHFRTAVIYQLTSNEVLFPLPQFIGRQLIYYENYLFKKALKFQIGGNVSFKSEFYGYGYMPAINEFYAQSNSQIGNYPSLDIFINTRLKRAQIYFKYEHFNAGWSGYTYYGTPGYPRLDKAFKFGVSWNMFD